MKRMGIVIVGVVLVVGCIFLFNQKDTKEILITEEQELNNTSLVFMLQDEEGNYNKSDTLPSTGYTFNDTKSVCSNNATPTWEDNKLYLNNLTKNGTSCYLYFDQLCPIGAEACETILADNPTIDNSRSNGITGPLTENTTGTLFTAEDDYGTSLIFAGDVDNNWVRFGGYYWRIIRINGDGSVRMIYSGEDTGSVTEANRTGESTQIGTSAFNEQYNDNAYVGYMYGTPGSDTYEETHANINDSTIKTVLDTWYQQNLLSYSEYISTEAGFCNDRKVQSEIWPGYGDLGYGTNATGYALAGRLTSNNGWKIDQTPTLKCSQSNDYFTTSYSSKGNHALVYSIGLITGDEAVLAGGFGGTVNDNYYLNTNLTYWTMSPSYFYDSNYNIHVFRVVSSGGIASNQIINMDGVRPVINLDASVTLTGSGTSADPYVVEGAE